MDLKPICTEDDYQTALRKASAFFANEPEPRTWEGDCFEILILLIQDYENKHYPVELPDPVDAIQFRMEQSGLTPKDFKPMIGRVVIDVKIAKPEDRQAFLDEIKRRFGVT